MAGTKTDSRQVINRVLLDIIANKTEYSGSSNNKPANSTYLYNLLSAINAELTVPYYMSESTVADLTLNIDSQEIQNPETSLNRIHSQTVNNPFTSGTVVFPAADGGNITSTPGAVSILSLASGFFKKVLIQISESGQLSVKQGGQAASIAAAQVPFPDARNVGIGYVILENSGGVIQNITNGRIYQYVNQEPFSYVKVQEIDGTPTVERVNTIKFPNGSVVDDGNGVVTIDLAALSNIVDSDGNSIIKLKPSITFFTLEAPDTTRWTFTVTEDGLIQSESGSTNPLTNLKIIRDDGEEVSFRVTNTGLLQAVTPPDGGTSLTDHIYLDSPAGVAWELRVTTNTANFVLESPNGTLFEVSIDDTGALETTEVATGEPQNIKIKRDDLTEVGLTVSDLGALETNNPPQVGAVSKSIVYLESPDLTIWEVKIDNTDVLYTETTIGVTHKSVIYTSSEPTWSNKFQILNDLDEPLFSVREFEEIDTTDTLRRGAFIEMPVLTMSELEAIEFPKLSSTKVTAEVYVDTGAGIRKVFFDTFDDEWKYMHDLSIVFP